MSLLGNLQNLFGKMGARITGHETESASVTTATPDSSSDSFSGVLGPSAMGGLAGLMSGRGMSGMLKGVLLGGGAALLWNKYKDRIMGDAQPAPSSLMPAASDADRARRMIRALVFAAKADGQVSANEKTAIARQSQQIGPQARHFVEQALEEQLDPRLVAEGVTDPEEALQLFTMSCASADADNFMTKNYLDALAKALGIPEDVQTDLMNKIKTAS